MRLPRLTSRKLIVAAVLAVCLAAASLAICFCVIVSSTRSAAVSFYERLSPGMAFAEVEAIAKNEVNVSKRIGSSTIWLGFGDPGSDRCDVFASFDADNHRLIGKDLFCCKNEVPRIINCVLYFVGVDLNKNRHFP